MPFGQPDSSNKGGANFQYFSSEFTVQFSRPLALAPVLIGDTTANSILSSLDGTRVLQEAGITIIILYYSNLLNAFLFARDSVDLARQDEI